MVLPPEPLTPTEAMVAMVMRGQEFKLVADIGGAAGIHLHKLRPHLHPTTAWHVVETPAMFSAVAWAGGGVSGAYFRRDVPDGAWLALFSGSLQYAASPMALLASVRDFRPQWLIVSRLCLSNGPTRLETQKSKLSTNGPGPLPRGFRDEVVRYERTVLNRSEFLAGFAGYDLVLEWAEGGDSGAGFVFERSK